MIEGFDEETAPLHGLEKKIVPKIIAILYPRRTCHEAVRGSEICRMIEADTGHQLKESRLRKITNFLRSDAILPICATSKGYFVSYDVEQLESQIRSLSQRRDAIDNSIDGLTVILNKIKSGKK
jgi:hypothetical protein